MGMIQGLMKKVPDGKPPAEYLAEVQGRLPDFAEGADHFHASILKAEQFEGTWPFQDNLNQEAKEKYRALTQEGRVIYVEIDW